MTLSYHVERRVQCFLDPNPDIGSDKLTWLEFWAQRDVFPDIQELFILASEVLKEQSSCGK